MRQARLWRVVAPLCPLSGRIWEFRTSSGNETSAGWGRRLPVARLRLSQRDEQRVSMGTVRNERWTVKTPHSSEFRLDTVDFFSMSQSCFR